MSLQFQIITSSPSEPVFDGRSIIREAFLASGINEQAADVMLSSISSNTLKQYLPSIVDWAKYCNFRGLSLTNPKVPEVVIYLTQKFQDGLSYGR